MVLITKTIEDDLSMYSEDRNSLSRMLLKNLKSHLPELKKLLSNYTVNSKIEPLPTSHWLYEDQIYRYYHGSFKVFTLQGDTLAIVEALKSLLPERKLNEMFMEIIHQGTGKEFNHSMNQEWSKHTRPIVEAFFHAKYMLEMAVKYSKLKYPPRCMPSGWAAFLYLYRLR